MEDICTCKWEINASIHQIHDLIQNHEQKIMSEDHKKEIENLNSSFLSGSIKRKSICEKIKTFYFKPEIFRFKEIQIHLENEITINKRLKDAMASDNERQRILQEAIKSEDFELVIRINQLSDPESGDSRDASAISASENKNPDMTEEINEMISNIEHLMREELEQNPNLDQKTIDNRIRNVNIKSFLTGDRNKYLSEKSEYIVDNVICNIMFNRPGLLRRGLKTKKNTFQHMKKIAGRVATNNSNHSVFK